MPQQAAHGDASPEDTAEEQTAVTREEEKQKPLIVCVHACMCMCVRTHIIHYDQYVGHFDRNDQLL